MSDQPADETSVAARRAAFAEQAAREGALARANRAQQEAHERKNAIRTRVLHVAVTATALAAAAVTIIAIWIKRAFFLSMPDGPWWCEFPQCKFPDVAVAFGDEQSTLLTAVVAILLLLAGILSAKRKYPIAVVLLSIALLVSYGDYFRLSGTYSPLPLGYLWQGYLEDAYRQSGEYFGWKAQDASFLLTLLATGLCVLALVQSRQSKTA